ncbi:MAG: FAD-dependent oxidoreductase [Methylococcales bacterium]
MVETTLGIDSNQSDCSLALGISGFQFTDLFQPERLTLLSDRFDSFVNERDPDLYEAFEAYRKSLGEGMAPRDISELLVRMAPCVGEFLALLFDVTADRAKQIASVKNELDTVLEFRNEIVMKVAKKFLKENPAAWDTPSMENKLRILLEKGFPEFVAKQDKEYWIAAAAVCLHGAGKHSPSRMDGENALCGSLDMLRQRLSSDAAASVVFKAALANDTLPVFAENLLESIERWVHAAATLPELNAQVQNWVSFRIPGKTDFSHLVEVEIHQRDSVTRLMGPRQHRRRRDGFALTDPRYGQRDVLYEVDHCIYCHDRDTDSCSKGMRNKKQPGYKVNPLGIDITGCPLEEKISEMHWLKRQGDSIAALALVIIDNPLCPGTGHRICNDCMKGCIYQKTQAVDIPQIETSVLTDVLFMPYGFEIYSLLTRWNPLNIKRRHALAYNGKNVLIAGLGPAGYTLAHYLLNEGFGVVGIDALKIEPLPEELVGSRDRYPKPIKDFLELYEDLDKRILAGFGGVAEYGITVRWDKNFLKVIYLTLARRKSFKIYGGVRFGGTLSIDDAWKLGFDHIAIASGAGKPTVIGLKNNLIRGIRKASDFLMALQLTGAAKRSSLANLQVRLPAGVIGGGLTAIDTATELMAYYPIQVEKILNRYEKLVEVYGQDAVLGRYDEEERLILFEFLNHGRAIRAERERAAKVGEMPDFQPLIETWGGVTVFYRKGMKDAPAYRQNHEEINKALEEGIAWAEGMNPEEAIADEYGHLKTVLFEKFEAEGDRWKTSGTKVVVPLRSLYVAAGTSPNTIYESEHPGTFEMDHKFFRRYELGWRIATMEMIPMDDHGGPKIAKPAPFTSYEQNGRFITFYGDNHPVYAGNVVKAMASAKDGYPYVTSLFQNDFDALRIEDQPARDKALQSLFDKLDDRLLATVQEVKRLTPTIIEVIVRAPLQAERFFPGQFYRVQNYEAYSKKIGDTVLATEGLALTGAWVDKDKGLISLIALEMGSSSRICALWQPGDPVVVMGVTGAPTEIPSGKTVLLAGGGLGNAVLFSIGKAMRAARNRVVYFAGYKNSYDVFKVDEIEAASDLIVWSVDPLAGAIAIQPTRPQDRTCVGNIIQAMEAYAKGELGEITIRLDDVDEMIVIGSDRMMAAVKEARYGVLKPYLKQHKAIGSINSPMQCMMKGVCAQCLCKHIDPETGEEYFVYSCYNQDQDLDRVDFPNLNARLRQNTVQEKLSNLWLDYLLESLDS